MDISDVVKEINIDPAYANSSVVQYYGDGKSYLLPLKTTPAGFFYNTELVGPGKKYELPETWDDMWELGKQLNEEGNGVKLFTYPVKGYFDNTLNALLGQSGGEEFLKNVLTYKEGVWDTKEGLKFLTQSLNLFHLKTYIQIQYQMLMRKMDLQLTSRLLLMEKHCSCQW